MKISKALSKARDYEHAFAVMDETKPVFHAAAPVGWMNDPNGFSVFDNQYHLFYQYHPYSTKWGPMHWGHLTSKDLVQWDVLPCALAPDTPADEDGCFSGTAIEHDGKHILMYTGCNNGKQVQCIAVGDGADYVKFSDNPVIDVGAKDFRDPKLWHDGACFRAAVPYRGNDGSGEILEYTSHDLKKWVHAGTMDRSDNRLGKMWECPDIFTLNDRRVMLISAQEAEGLKKELHPGNVSFYLMYDENGQREGEARAIDYGLDFYAPQTLETSDGRRIMIAWANNWENYLTPESFRYSGMMTIPRELTLRDGRLYQAPIRELDAYLKESSRPNNGRVFDLRIEARTRDWFAIKLASDGKRYTEIKYDYVRNTLTVDRTCSGSRKDVLHTRSIDVPDRDGEISLRVLMDKYIMEVFVNDGEQVLTNLLYTPLDCDGIELAGAQCSYDIIKYDFVDS